MVIGITGLTGSGKSYLTEKLNKFYKNSKVLDCDKIYHSLIQSNKPCWHELVETFGYEIVHPETNEIDRKILAEIIFSDINKKHILELITWRYIREAVFTEIENSHNTTIIIDSPLLFPSGLDKLCNKIIITEASLVKRLDRIITRDHLSDEQALTRVYNQPKIDQIRKNIIYIQTDDGINGYQTEKIIKFIGG